ncbi:MAG: thiamine phosphate synthase [Clostridiales bacterium]|nr:thiamine phosphate synthase [Clostridiales bacterium]
MGRTEHEWHGSDIICVTNRKLIRGYDAERDWNPLFLQKITEIAECHPAGIILREKDLPEAEYEALAGQVMEICARCGVRCILHTFVRAAENLHAEVFHAPLSVLRGMSETQKKQFAVLGASCHSVEDAMEAQRLGCTYLTAGHIFATDCKKGLPGRGLDFLREVCAAVDIPVYAIGGITPDNAAEVCRAGAAGVCIMSGLMQCENVAEVISHAANGI